MLLVTDVYGRTKTFPSEEMYGLTAQICRAAGAVPANIAEGKGRRYGREFHQFLGNARGSLMELDTHLELALRVGYMNEGQHLALQLKVGRSR